MSLKIVFTGLCVFVRLSPQKVRVLMPNFSDPVMIHHSSPMSGHAAYLAWKRGDERITTLPFGSSPGRLAQFAVASRMTQDLTDVFLLDQEAITLDTNPPSLPQEVQFETGGMVDMQQIVRKSVIDATFVADHYDPRPERVTAFIDITTGKVEPIRLTRTLEFRPVVEGHEAYRGEFAEEVIWTLPPNRYVLRSRTFGPKAAQTQFEIDATGAGDLMLRAGNLPLEDLVHPDSPRVIARDSDVIDHHFHRFYEVCATRPDVHPLPHRVSAKVRQFRSLGDNCPPMVIPKP